MNDIYNIINKKTNGKYGAVRFAKVTFDKTATVTVVCDKADRSFVYDNLAELQALITETCAFHTPVKLTVDDTPPTPAILRSAVVKFTEKFAYVSSILHTVTAETEPECAVKLKMHGVMYDLAKNDYIVRLKEFLENSFARKIRLDVDVVEFAESGTDYAVASGGGKREYKLSAVTPVIGDLKPDIAQSVSSIESNGFNVIVCGIFAMPTEFTSKGGRRYEKFLVYDGETSLQCRFFPPDAQTTLIRPELLNTPVCVCGNVEYDAKRNEATMAVRELSRCAAQGLDPVLPQKTPQSYGRVTPTPYEEYVQSSMFDMAKESDLPEILKGSFVVFDFETTGLSALYDKPTELGAVRVDNGKITEIFSTLIDPRRPIPAEVSEKTGITDDMVKGQPLFEDILPDFYKFCDGCALVGHNIAFDYPFLLKGGNRSGWAFGNRSTYDTMGIAPKAFPDIARVSLDSVLERLGLVNESAHRAYADAAATAKAFVAMLKMLNK